MSRLRSFFPIMAAVATALALALVAAPRTEDASMAARWYSGDPVIAAAERQVILLFDSVRVLERQWERADSYEKSRALTARGNEIAIRIDSDIDPAIARTFAEHAAAELRALTASPEHPVVLRITQDPLTRFGYRRATMLPARPDGPCVALVRLPSARIEHARPARLDQLLGICGLYARFGPPGPGIEGWLERTRLRGAVAHTGFPAPRGRQENLSSTFFLGWAAPAACLSERPGACLRMFDGGFNPPSPQTYGTRAMPDSAPNTVPDELRRVAVFERYAATSAAGTALHDLRTSIGDERFRVIWRSAAEPAAAFEANEGRTLDSWVHDQLSARVEPYRAGPMIPRFPLILTLALLAGFAGAAIRFTKREYQG